MGGFYDFILITKDLQKETFSPKYLQFIKREEEMGCNKLHYKLDHGYSPCNLFYYEDYNKIQIALNLPYFAQGHNYNIPIQKEIDTIEYISLTIGVNLFKSDATKFEFGSLFKIPFEYKRINSSHLKIKGMATRSYDSGKYFLDRNIQHRLYNGQKNLKNKLTIQQRSELKETTDYQEEAEYIKIENRYLRPEVALKRRGILLEDLFKTEFLDHCKADLLAKYQAIIKTGGVKVESKKQLTSESLYLIALKQLEGLTGINSEEHVKSVIKSFAHILSPEDRKARLRQLKKNTQQLQTAPSPYDVTELLRASLYVSDN